MFCWLLNHAAPDKLEQMNGFDVDMMGKDSIE
jgi:hypothetical protein